MADPAAAERRLPDEDAVAARIAGELARLVARNRANRNGACPFHRAAHAKAHACVRATFTVADTLPAPLRHGIFARPQQFSAWIRFSNGDTSLKHDWLRDGHGMAIKLIEAEQDFLLADHPVTFARDIHEFEAFASAFADRRVGQYAFGRARSAHTELARRIIATLRRIGNPLTTTYWSQTPYALGPHIVKYAARPADGAPKAKAGWSRNYLRNAVVGWLAGRDAHFDFLVQVRTCDDLPVEDATVEWPEATAPFVAVASIHIPSQTCDAADRIALGEQLSFTPWRVLPEHRPLGNLNRARRIVYDTLSRLRHDENRRRGLL